MGCWFKKLMKCKKVQIIILCAVLLLIAFGLNGIVSRKKDVKAIHAYFSHFQEDTIVTAMVSKHEMDSPDISVDILNTELLSRFLSIIQAEENLSLTRCKDSLNIGTVASEAVYIRSRDGSELLLNSWGQNHFEIVTDEDHRLFRDHYIVFLPGLYDEVFSPALNKADLFQ